MVPTAVLFFPRPHIPRSWLQLIIIFHKNNITTIIGGSGGSVGSNFGVYQQITVGLSNLSIRTLVLDTISSEPYRKALIANLYFHQILSLADSPSVGLNDLLSTVASYFSINTRFAEREADTAARSISRSFFRVSYLTEVIFSDASGKSIKVPNPDSRPMYLTYFTFRSTVLAQNVDYRTLSKSITFWIFFALTPNF